MSIPSQPLPIKYKLVPSEYQLENPSKATSSFQSYLPGFHSWVDSDYQKYGHPTAPSTTNRLGLVFTTGLAVKPLQHHI